ncbi:MAG: DUF444 family protein [Legionellales bacterium]|nr:DUF444 family protein [Legionellales bacterium]
MSQIIDRRTNVPVKSSINRQRFLRRYRTQIKQKIAKAISQRSITEMDQGESVTLPSKNITEPIFHYAPGGIVEHILPGNHQFEVGDRLKKDNKSTNSSGSCASDQGEDEDDFVFELSREEFLDLYFEDLELPDLVKKQLTRIPNYKYIRAGFSTTGTAANINVVRSMRQAIGRRLAFAGPYRTRLQTAKDALAVLPDDINDEQAQLEKNKLLAEIEYLQHKINVIPFLDKVDLRFNYRVKQPVPSTQAVMFCLMDVSGSMDEIKKDIAKRFFILLYIFLTRTYEHIEIVFIRHHTSAKEVDEQEFFYSRETGGTVVSSALELMHQISSKRYPEQDWNIYVAQASDGDNWNADSPYCQQLLLNEIMPHVQYFTYVEIMPRHHQSLWQAYQSVAEHHPNFTMRTIEKIEEIYPVFRDLFQQTASEYLVTGD